jgi:uncharacterized protein YggE
MFSARVFCPHVVLSAALLACGSCAVALAQDTPRFEVGKDHRSIAITATESVTHLADVATVSIGYQLYGPDKDAAYAAGSHASNAIIDALKKAGVPADAIESQSQSVTENRYFDAKVSAAERAAKAFIIEQSWTVRTNAADAAKVLDLAVKAGANNSGNINWSLQDPNAAQAEAASKALQRARTQAAAMAGGLNVQLGELIYASNQVQAEAVRPPMAMMAMAKVSAAPPPPLAINARQIETSATVYAVFAIQ